MKCEELCVILLHHYLEKHQIEVNLLVYTELLLTESGHELDVWNVTLNLSNKKPTYYVIKGLFDGVDGVVCGSAFVCCNQNTITLKCVLFATKVLMYYASVLYICEWQRECHLVSIHKPLKTWSLLVCWLQFHLIFLSPSS